MPVAKILASMEYQGAKVDKDVLKNLENNSVKKLKF